MKYKSYKMRLFKSLALLPLVLSFFVLLFNAMPAMAAGNIEQDAGPYHVIVQTQPENPVANQAMTMSITVENKATGQPVTNAMVNMDMMLMNNSMPGMSMATSTVMHGQGQMAMQPGMYMMNLTPTQQGSWKQTLHISSPMGNTTMTIPMNVGKAGPNWVLIGSIAGIVILAGIIAGIIKHKRA